MTATKANPTALVLAGVALAIATIAAWVYMSAHHIDGGGLMVFVTPLVTALLVSGPIAAQRQTLDDHGTTLAKISKQTNGVLDQRIRDGVTAALAARDTALVAGATHADQPAPSLFAGTAPAPAPAPAPVPPAAPPAPVHITAPNELTSA